MRQDHVVTFSPYDPQDDSNVILCPMCRNNYLHPVEVDVNSVGNADTRAIIDTNGVRLAQTAPSGRGVRIELSFWCEGCHEIPVLTMQFHEGVTFCTWRGRGKTDPDEAPLVIWRD